jgi:hypothetical protein
MPDGAGGNQPDHEEIERRLRELSQEISRPRGSEPTPLERLVAAKQAEKKAQRKKDTRVLAGLVVALLLLAGGSVATWLRVAPPSWLHHRAVARAAPSARTGPKVKLATPFSTVTSQGAPSDPFADSPAAHWADGAAGITIPAAKAHGPYSAAQVRSAYETTRKMLIAGNLDWPTLRGGTPTAFEHLLIKDERADFVNGLHTTALYKDGSEKNTRTWITSFAPGSTQFVTTDVKVHGTMSASVAKESGTEVLRITVDYLFVFAVEPPGDPADWMRVVQQQSGTVDFAQWDDPGGPLEPWFGVTGSPAGARCDTRDGYVHPDYSTGPPSTVQPSGPPVNPYSMATTAPGAGCQVTTGT